MDQTGRRVGRFVVRTARRASDGTAQDALFAAAAAAGCSLGVRPGVLATRMNGVRSASEVLGVRARPAVWFPPPPRRRPRLFRARTRAHMRPPTLASGRVGLWSSRTPFFFLFLSLADADPALGWTCTLPFPLSRPKSCGKTGRTTWKGAASWRNNSSLPSPRGAVSSRREFSRPFVVTSATVTPLPAGMITAAALQRATCRRHFRFRRPRREAPRHATPRPESESNLECTKGPRLEGVVLSRNCGKVTETRGAYSETT